MRLSAIVAVAAVLAVASAIQVTALTDVGHGEPTGDRVDVFAQKDPVYSVGGGGGVSRCSWVRMYLDRVPDEEFTEGDIPVSPTGAGPLVEREIDGVLHRLFRVSCPGGVGSDRWVRIGMTVADLIGGVTDRASALLQLPVLDVNPEPVDGGIVNVGLWLAVEPQVVPAVSAEAGPTVWITVSPTLASTRFDFGNGDQVVCAGTGVPIRDVHPDLDVQDESPTCGYTYRRSSPDGDPYRLTVTAIWELPYVSSAGAGTIPALERSVTVDYDVDEVQTVGISN